jgi:hypothetical protein
MTDKTAAAGLTVAQLWVLDSAAYPISTTGTLANGSDGGGMILTGIKSASGQAREPSRVQSTGDDRRTKFQFIFPTDELPAMEMQFNVRDLIRDAAIAAANKVAISTTMTAIGGDTNEAFDIQCCVILSGIAKSADTASFGATRYRNRIYPSVNVMYIDENWEEVQEATYQYRGYPTQAAKFPWGLAFNVTSHGVTKAAWVDVFSNYPITLHTLIGDNATTSFTVDYTPAGVSTSGSVKVWQDGVEIADAGVTVTTATKTVAITTAPTTAAKVIVLYESAELASV